MNQLNNINVGSFTKLIKPHILKKECIKLEPNGTQLILDTRQEIKNILGKKSTKKLFIVGPCSIHDIELAKDYGRRLKEISDQVNDKILVVMRVYFEKPRTTIGWKGLINDPHLDNSFDVNEGLKQARELLVYLNNIGMPCGCEFLDVVTPQYISDLISWGAIGARTTESQVHRQMVSGLSMPVGFKNGTGGSIKLANDAILSAQFKHCFMAINDEGEPSICQTRGNPDCHIILRGGKQPNYHKEDVDQTIELLKSNNVRPRVMIDCSHSNSNKNHENQHIVLDSVIEQMKTNTDIIGVMIESNIRAGKQKLVKKEDLIYGISITDACIDIDETKTLICRTWIQLTI